MSTYKFPETGELSIIPNERAFAAFASDIEHLGFRGQARAMFNGTKFNLIQRPDGDCYNYWLYEAETGAPPTTITVFNT